MLFELRLVGDTICLGSENGKESRGSCAPPGIAARHSGTFSLVVLSRNLLKALGNYCVARRGRAVARRIIGSALPKSRTVRS
jgi:hypothetical protein